VSGTVKPDGTFQLTILSQPSTNTWKWECSFSHAGINIGTLTTDEGADLGPPTLVFEIAATDGAQAQGSQDLGGYGGTTGSATWTLQIHKQAAP
jgi:heme oxygenase